ncbi:hypothetical protein BM1_04333 [Bipolaris maydis]|nr:hypothetical protein BM1_04333 [Bipolaris maydis]
MTLCGVDFQVAEDLALEPALALADIPEASSSIRRAVTFKMITDSQLYSLAIFLGSAAMLLIVVYHFLEVNSDDHKIEEKPRAAGAKVKA